MIKMMGYEKREPARRSSTPFGISLYLTALRLCYREIHSAGLHAQFTLLGNKRAERARGMPHGPR